MADSFVTTERRLDGVALVRLDRPKANALSIAVLGEIRAAAEDLIADPPGAVVLWAGRRARGALVAHGLAKAAVDQGLDGTLDAGLALEQRAFAAGARTEDAARGIASFAEHGPGRATFVAR